MNDLKLTITTGPQENLLNWLEHEFSIGFLDQYGLSKKFGQLVKNDVDHFLTDYKPTNSEIWTAYLNDKIVGSITLDRVNDDNIDARLRWFIISKEARGLGMGQNLLSRALNFAKDRHYKSVYLWTLQGLEPAGSLYRKFGFHLETAKINDQWGMYLPEEKLRLNL
jgi:GNAT superfamily N-acetyltransferase